MHVQISEGFEPCLSITFFIALKQASGSKELARPALRPSILPQKSIGKYVFFKKQKEKHLLYLCAFVSAYAHCVCVITNTMVHMWRQQDNSLE